MLPVVWVTCAAFIIRAAVRSRRHLGGLAVGRTVAALYLGPARR